MFGIRLLHRLRLRLVIFGIARNGWLRDSQQVSYVREGIDKEVAVLEESQKPEVHHQRGDQIGAPLPRPRQKPRHRLPIRQILVKRIDAGKGRGGWGQMLNVSHLPPDGSTLPGRTIG